MRAASVSAVNGFISKLVTPVGSSPVPARSGWPEMNRILSPGRIRSAAFARSAPFMRGITTSVTSTSTRSFSFLKVSSALTPSSASITVKPRRVSSVETRRRTELSSSASSTMPAPLTTYRTGVASDGIGAAERSVCRGK